MATDEEIIAEYRGLLTKTEQESQSEYDKTVLALSGGALGVSFAFLKDVVGPGPILCGGLLVAAWICWALSSTAVLVSFFTSQLALRKAIHQLDKGEGMDRPGGWFDKGTSILNLSGLVLFLGGLGCMMIFLGFNVPHRVAAVDAPPVPPAVQTSTNP